MKKHLLIILLILSGLSGLAQNSFRTRQSGDWSDPNTWEEDAGGGFAVTLNTPTSTDGVITIRNAHTVTVTANVTIDETTIASGGAIIINGAVTLTLDEDFTSNPLNVSAGGSLSNTGTLDLSTLLIISPCSVDGSFTNSGTVSIADNSLLSFNGGSSYFHNFTTGGAIPLATWNANSTCEINNLSAASPASPTNLNQIFGNFRWNTPSMGTTAVFSLGGNLTSVAGNLIFTTSNTRAIRLNRSGSGFTFNIGGNFDNQGVPIIVADNLSSACTININGTYTQSQPGVLVPSFIFCASSNANDVTFNVKGNFTRSAGTISRGSTSSSTVQTNFIFNGTGTQTYSFTGAGSIATQINYSILSGATLDVGTSSLTGTGAFANSGTLRVGSLDASGSIQTGTTNGNIRVSGIRTYASGSTIVYNGAGVQFLGNGHPSSSNISTQINNASGVTMVSDATIDGSLTLTTGNLSISGSTLTINGSFTPNSNFLNVTSSSSLSIGGAGAFGNLPLVGGPSINNLTLNRTSGSITLTSDLTIGGTFTQTAGDINLNGRTLTVRGPYTRASGNIVGTSTSSLIIDGAGSLPSAPGIGISGGALNTLTINRASATLESSSAFSVTNLNLLAGTFQNGGTVSMTSGGAIITRNVGSITGAGSIVAVSSYDVTYTNSSVTPVVTGAELPSGTTQLRHLTINSTGDVNLNSAITVNGILTFTSGLFNAGSNAIDLKGNLVSNNTSQLTSSSITFSGNTNVSGNTQVIFGNVTVTGTLTPTSALAINGNLVNNGILNSGSGTVTFGGTTLISGSSISSFNNVVISPSSTLTAPSSTMNVGGTWTNNGTFANNSGTVVFNGNSSIAGTSTTNFGGLTIAPSSTLTAPTTLNVARDFTNNGAFTSGTGTLVLDGTSTQLILGSSVTTFNNIIVANTAGPPSVRVQSNQNLQGVLTLASNSIFDADGSSNTSVFTLLSSGDNPTVDASIAAIPSGASVTGNVTVQRYMTIEGPNSTRIYRYVSSPVQAAPVSDIQLEIPITGAFTGASSCSGCGSSQSMFSYTESVITGGANGGYTNFPAATNSETLIPGLGYAIFVRGNLLSGSARWDVTGPINSGNVTLGGASGISFTSSGVLADDGWNLVGNPYPSTIDWNAAGWTKTNLDGSTYMLDNNTGVYAIFNGITGTNGASRYISSGQAFFVKASSLSPSLLVTENVKAAGTQTAFIREGTPENLLRIALRKDGIQDEMIVHFREGATVEFDSQMDAWKLKNSTINFASITDANLKLAINSLPPLPLLEGCSTPVKLDISDVSSGTYELSFSEFESFPADIAISMLDKFSNKTQDIRINSTYSFSIDKDVPATFGSDRFVVTFNSAVLTSNLSVLGGQSCKTGSVTLNASGSPAGGSYRWYTSKESLTPISGQITGSFVTPELTANTTYYVAAVNSFGCEGLRKEVLAEVANYQDAKILQIDNTTLSSSYSSGNQWYKDGKLIVGATSQQLKIDGTGTYKVEVKIGNCTTSTEGPYVVTGLESIDNEAVLSVFPNPTTGIVQVSVKANTSPKVDIQNSLGQSFAKIEMRKEGLQYKGSYDLSSNSSGLYFVRIIDESTGIQTVKKVIKN